MSWLCYIRKSFLRNVFKNIFLFQEVNQKNFFVSFCYQNCDHIACFVNTWFRRPLYKDRVKDSVLILENTVQQKAVFLHILRSMSLVIPIIIFKAGTKLFVKQETKN